MEKFLTVGELIKTLEGYRRDLPVEILSQGGRCTFATGVNWDVPNVVVISGDDEGIANAPRTQIKGPRRPS